MVEGRYIPGHCLHGRILAFHLVVAEAIQRLDSSWPARWETLGNHQACSTDWPWEIRDMNMFISASLAEHNYYRNLPTGNSGGFVTKMMPWNNGTASAPLLEFWKKAEKAEGFHTSYRFVDRPLAFKIVRSMRRHLYFLKGQWRVSLLIWSMLPTKNFLLYTVIENRII